MSEEHCSGITYISAEDAIAYTMRDQNEQACGSCFVCIERREGVYIRRSGCECGGDDRVVIIAFLAHGDVSVLREVCDEVVEDKRG